MFDVPLTAGLAAPPRQGVAARVVRGFGRLRGALHSAVTAGLRRRQPVPATGAAPGADNPPARRRTRAPRRHRSILPALTPRPARPGWLTRLFGRRRPAVIREDDHKLPDLAFTQEAFPGLSPEALAFFNTPLEECDPEMLRIVLAALTEVIATAMTPRDGVQDTQDTLCALSDRFAALLAAVPPEPPATEPKSVAPADVSPDTLTDATVFADATTIAAMHPHPAASNITSSAISYGQVLPQPGGTAGAQLAAPMVTAHDQRHAAPVVPPSSAYSETKTHLPGARATGVIAMTPRRSRRQSFSDAPSFAGRRLMLLYRDITFVYHNMVLFLLPPPRLLCYAACTGPP